MSGHGVNGHLPVPGQLGLPVLSIAGSDPSGGAGIQADLKAIGACGGYGMSVITALTAQNTRGVQGVHVPPVDFLVQQLRSVLSDVPPAAIKIGMLGSAEVILAVAGELAALEAAGIRPPVVLDPVMVATSGDRLLTPEGESAMSRLFAHVDIVTPNARKPPPSWATTRPPAPRTSSRRRGAWRASTACGCSPRAGTCRPRSPAPPRPPSLQPSPASRGREASARRRALSPTCSSRPRARSRA